MSAHDGAQEADKTPKFDIAVDLPDRVVIGSTIYGSLVVHALPGDDVTRKMGQMQEYVDTPVGQAMLENRSFGLKPGKTKRIPLAYSVTTNTPGVAPGSTFRLTFSVTWKGATRTLDHTILVAAY